VPESTAALLLRQSSKRKRCATKSSLSPSVSYRQPYLFLGTTHHYNRQITNMLSRAANTLLRTKTTQVANSISAPMGTRFYSLEEHASAKSAWEKSCYFEMDFTIPETSSVYEAVQKFAAYDVGCLVTTDAAGKF
jgi:hypothetical protein